MRSVVCVVHAAMGPPYNILRHYGRTVLGALRNGSFTDLQTRYLSQRVYLPPYLLPSPIFHGRRLLPGMNSRSRSIRDTILGDDDDNNDDDDESGARVNSLHS